MAEDGFREALTREDLSCWEIALLAHPGVPNFAKAVGETLKTHRNMKTGRLNPSVGRLAKASSNSKRTVNEALRILRFYGFVTSQGLGRTSCHFQLWIPRNVTAMRTASLDERNDEAERAVG